jgi:succinate-acetate transporter protein
MGRDDNGLVRAFQSKHWGWWYLSIALSFLLLSIVHFMQGARLTVVALRVGVAAGFAFLGWMQLRSGR